jgi:hypothetical protein
MVVRATDKFRPESILRRIKKNQKVILKMYSSLQLYLIFERKMIVGFSSLKSIPRVLYEKILNVREITVIINKLVFSINV